MKQLFLYFLLFGFSVCVSAQKNIKPLTIGDRVPDIEFKNMINYPTRTAKLSDFKGKLIILDFWATWCAFLHCSISKDGFIAKNI